MQRHCLLCDTPENRGGNPFAGDTCYIHGQIRGILCLNCRTAVGRAERFWPANAQPWNTDRLKDYLQLCSDCDLSRITAIANAYDGISQPANDLPTPAERKRLRELHRVSQTTLAAELGVTRQSIYLWESSEDTGTVPTGINRDRYGAILAAWKLRNDEHSQG